jgi:enediyne biosynthesis protein E4
MRHRIETFDASILGFRLDFGKVAPTLAAGLPDPGVKSATAELPCPRHHAHRMNLRMSRREGNLGKLLIVLFLVTGSIHGQGMGHPTPPPPPHGARSPKCKDRPVPQLEDVAAKAEITFSHTSSPDKKYIFESMSGGVVIIDYDRDGWPDIYFTNAPTVDMAIKGQVSPGSLYHNNHDGTFTEVTRKAGLTTPCLAMGGAVGDYDNDGWPDLYITCLGGNILYHNNGNGTFSDVTAKAGVSDGRWSAGASFGDYDGDGFVDLMVANYVDFHLHDLPQFGSAPYCKYRGVDVQCGPRGLKGAGDSLFHNNGDGTFTDVSVAAGVSDPQGYYGLGVIWADFNGSGRPDIYITNDSTPKYLYRNLGNGKFEEIGFESGTALSSEGSEQASMGIAVGDYNHTGRPSLFITNFENENDDLYRNDGGYNFTEVSYPSGLAFSALPWVKWGTAFADLDNDGWLDLISTTGHVYPQVDAIPGEPGYRQPALLNLNQKDGTFCDASDQAGAALLQKRVGRGLAVADLFNDGNLDVVINDLDGRPLILRNHGIPGRHWVSLELAGTRSNRLALNARVTLTAGGMTQTGEVHSGGSYLSQSDLRLHFGLGSAAKIDKVEVRWPSGAIDRIGSLEADQSYSILEGHGIVPGDQIRPSAAAHMSSAKHE